MATALRPNWRPQRLEAGRAVSTPSSEKADVAFPCCPVAFLAISELNPGRGHRHPGTAIYLLGVSVGYRHNYRLGCCCTLNDEYSY